MGHWLTFRTFSENSNNFLSGLLTLITLKEVDETGEGHNQASLRRAIGRVAHIIVTKLVKLWHEAD